MPDWLTDSIKWYVIVMMVSAAAAPLARWLFAWLPDRGATVSRPLGLLVVVWPVWFVAGVSPVPYSAVLLWIAVAAIGVAGWFFAFRRSWITRDWIRTLAIVEAVSALAFFTYVGLRGFTPEIVWTEKPMDIAFLTSSARTLEIPPADPWFSGESINYYYLGYLIHGTIGRLASIPTWTGYNLALATTASMVLVAAGGLAYNALRTQFGRMVGIGAALLAAFFVVLAGNMHAFVEFLRDPGGVADQYWWPPGTVGWASSRVVFDTGSLQAETINEFPWFSLLLGDLHPHLTALPFSVLALSLALNALLSRRTSPLDSRTSLLRIAMSGCVIGALYPLNSLDLPTYLVVFTGAILLSSGWIRASAISISIASLCAVLVWMPFTARFVPFTGVDSTNMPDWLADLPVLPRLLTTVGFHDGERTSVAEYMTVFGFFWVATLVILGWVALEHERLHPLTPGMQRAGIGLGIAGVLVAIALEAPVVILAGVPLVVSLWVLTTGWRGTSRWSLVVPGLYAASYGLIFLTEFFYVQDAFEGRYNTLFKVYYQVWTMLAIATATGAVMLLVTVRPRKALFAGASALFVVGILAAAAYPVIATTQWTRVHGERSWKGLDGAAYLADYSADDLAAIRWLYDNMQEDDVIIEAPGCSYQVNGQVPTGRMAAFTGVPNIIGWGFHEVQWRGGQPELSAEISPRAADVASMYADPASSLVEEYDATVLFVGSFELNGAGDTCEIAGPFPSVNDPEFPGPGWEEVFSSGESRIYRKTES